MMQLAMVLNLWELVFVAAIALVLFGFGRVAGWHRVFVQDRYALLVIGAVLGLVFVLRFL